MMTDYVIRSQNAVRRGVLSITFVGLLVLAWEVAARRNTGAATAIPPPSEISDIIARHHGLLLQQAASTGLECAVGFFVAVVCGILLGALIAYSTSEKAHRAFQPSGR